MSLSISLESQYEDRLSSFAQKSSESRGRRHRELPHPYRNPFQRDRDRIVHSRAFRRLQYKTQVLVNYLGDHYRTRLTHSLEVSLISRSIARTLGLHEDLAEAIALAHDLGHSPFGHAGEQVLNSLMKEEGGFEHNLQSLRVVDRLENKYPQFPGLNLTYEVRKGLLKHSDFKNAELLKKENFNPEEAPTLEAQLVDVADGIAYSCHDLEDGLAYGYLHLDEVRALSVWNHTDISSGLTGKSHSDEVIFYHLVRYLIDCLVKNVVLEARRRIAHYEIHSIKDVLLCRHSLIGLPKPLEKDYLLLKDFLMDRFYHHPQILQVTRSTGKVMTTLFRHYENNPKELPNTTQKKTGYRSLKRVICDYMAGMTDRFALEEYKKKGFELDF